ncbi:hypothetical protein Y032_0167g133 [Ancylostoma ceylanicum]|uniref:Uncharacterized protein n=1 Tax=Ancylostoma ceylanicum TaxID=53326 RepID=A0A016SWK2_9BILA|nr:hypothetical protein Y032_0167g133 [Ancylostoma ceylanicum]
MVIKSTSHPPARYARLELCGLTYVSISETEIVRRIRAGWNCFNRHDKFLTSRTVEMKYERALFNMCTLPAMFYGVETWMLSKAAERKLACAQRRMERFMVGVRLLNKKTNAW